MRNARAEYFDIYHRPVSAPSWRRERISFGDYLFRDHPHGVVFSLYRDESCFPKLDPVEYWGQPNYKWHPVCFKTHAVHVVITEFDKKPDYQMVPADEYKAKLPKVGYNKYRVVYSDQEYAHHHDYAIDVLGSLKKDKQVFFAYLSSGGLGVRVALFSDEQLDQETYPTFCKEWTYRLLEKHDKKGLLMADPNCFDGSLSWFPPRYPKHLWVNDKCRES